MANYQPPLVALVLALVAFALIGYGAPPAMTLGRLDVYWDWCRYLHCSCQFPVMTGPLGQAELEVHSQGYTVRIDPTLEIDIKRKDGELDVNLLSEVAASLKLSEEHGYPSIYIYVESGLPLDDYIRSIDALEAIHLPAKLRFEEPPDRSICLNRQGCVPVATPDPRY